MHIFHATRTWSSPDYSHNRKLRFLHHIVNLPEDDPVKCVFEEQKLFTHEPDWFNEIVTLLEKYGLESNLDIIRDLAKDKWKQLVTRAVKEDAFRTLSAECASKTKTSMLTYTELSQQQYFKTLSPHQARTYFQIRGDIYDIKCSRPYLYNDDTCRICKAGSENIDHVLNHCSQVDRSNVQINNIYETDELLTLELVQRVHQFKKKLDLLQE